MPSGQMKALLTVLAVAGYQNRDKIADLLRKVTERPSAAPAPGSAGATTAEDRTAGGTAGAPSGGLDDLVEKLRTGGLGSILGGGALGGGLGSILNGGLNDLLDQFRQAGQQRKAESWVNTGDNEPIQESELQQALGPDVLRDLAAKTGLSEEEVLKRLSKNLPDAVDEMTPGGSIPPAMNA